MKKKLMTLFAAMLVVALTVCFAAAIGEKVADLLEKTDPVAVATATGATATGATDTDATDTDATATDATATDATATGATATDATATDATATDATDTDAPRALGDVNGDGEIAPEDARLALRASVGL